MISPTLHGLVQHRLGDVRHLAVLLNGMLLLFVVFAKQFLLDGFVLYYSNSEAGWRAQIGSF